MNLHRIASGAIGRVNPFIKAVLKQSIGYTTDASSHRYPTYAPLIETSVQRQSISQGELRKLEGMNIQGVDTTIYMNGALNGDVRILAKGGDLVQFDGNWWLVVAVLERWPDWAKLAVKLQNGG